MNREIRRTEKDGSVTRQFYDKNGQLIATTDGTGAGADFHYDLGGRRTHIET
ncbi:MAG: RHS repeat protein [Lachnospiraceae bacterium]|nr:RHS repeat protein [Lachnospiraceae bacterium]MEE1255063.1 hypothetical protein [Lachnospiraceae bacterium]